jgi:hypothetical protein
MLDSTSIMHGAQQVQSTMSAIQQALTIIIPPLILIVTTVHAVLSKLRHNKIMDAAKPNETLK